MSHPLRQRAWVNWSWVHAQRMGHPAGFFVEHECEIVVTGGFMSHPLRQGAWATEAGFTRKGWGTRPYKVLKKKVKPGRNQNSLQPIKFDVLFSHI